MASRATPTTSNAGLPDGAVFDVVIVGAGAAGCILAARLSEDPQRRVALLEAGDDMLPGTEHRDILDPLPIAYGVPGRSWEGLVADITVRASTNTTRRTKRFTQGLGLGGSSTINGSFAFRGQPEDYDGWASAGATGWGWKDVLPFFRKLETDTDVDGLLHGATGPISIRREPPGNWAPFSHYLAERLIEKGYPWLDDYNGQFEDGCGSPPMANTPDRRIPTASAYLTAEVRRRPNLSIAPNMQAEKLVFDGRTVTGIRVRHGGREATVNGREVILSCGGIFTPVLLQRSGVGSATRLRSLGIDVVTDLPGVGEGLKNHPKIDVAFHLSNAARQRQEIRSIGQVCARYSSGQPGCQPHDMGLVAVNRSTWHALGRQIGALMVALYQPVSSGHVRLKAAGGRPEDVDIQFALLDDERDFARMRDGLSFALRLLAGAQQRGIINTVFTPNAKLVAKLQSRTAVNAIAAELIRALFANTTLREMALGSGVLDIAGLAGSQDRLDGIVQRNANLSHHVCSTSRMGDPSDLGTVVAPDCRVHGLSGLRVVDASIFPQIPRAGMFVPVMMAAEKAAHDIERETNS